MPRQSRDHHAERRKYLLDGSNKIIYKRMKGNEAGCEPFQIIGEIFKLKKCYNLKGLFQMKNLGFI